MAETERQQADTPPIGKSRHRAADRRAAPPPSAARITRHEYRQAVSERLEISSH